MKAKGAVEAKAIMRHCDQSEREKNKHSNKDINKALTAQNWSMRGLSYSAACKEYDARIAELDSKLGANRRKDRVTYMGIDIPAPADLRKDQLRPWFQRAWEIFQEQTHGAGIEGWVHVDEVHDYMRDGRITTSREHMHIGAVPAVNGRLCGKEFSSRRQIVALNNAIQEMSVNEFGIVWMDGTGRKSKETVEGLKGKSLAELEAWERNLNEREQAVSVREKYLDEREREVEKRSDQVSKYVDRARSAAERVEKQAEIIDRVRERTREDITPDWLDDGLPAAVRPFKGVLKRSYMDYKVDRAKEAAQQRQAEEAARKKAEAEQKALAEAEAAERRRREDAERRWQEREEREQTERKRRLEALAAKQAEEREMRYRRVVSEQPKAEREQEQSDDFDLSL